MPYKETSQSVVALHVIGFQDSFYIFFSIHVIPLLSGNTVNDPKWTTCFHRAAVCSFDVCWTICFSKSGVPGFVVYGQGAWKSLSLPSSNETKYCDNSSVIHKKLVLIGFILAWYLQLPLISAIIVSGQKVGQGRHLKYKIFYFFCLKVFLVLTNTYFCLLQMLIPSNSITYIKKTSELRNS